MSIVYAEDVNISGLQNPASKISVGSNIGNILTGGGFNVVNLVFFLVGLVFFFNLVSAGWEYVTASGDPKKIAAATQRLLNSFFGVALALGSFLIVQIISSFIGISNFGSGEVPIDSTYTKTQ